MLGIAFSEAARSQEIMTRLHTDKYGRVQPPPSGRVGGSVGAGSSVGSGSDANGSTKRKRRRRRTKKPAGGPYPHRPPPGGANRPARQQQQPGGGGPRPQHGNGARTRRHDAPMEKRDLYLALRCGMVATGPTGEDHAVGRVTLVNWENQIVLDTFVKVPPETVYNYRTEHTGITAELLAMTSALRFDTARSKVGNLIKGKILIGHGLEVDLTALGLSHPWSDVRDNATYSPYMKTVQDALSTMMLPRPLDELMAYVFRRSLNPDQPTLVREAVGCLELYKHGRKEWEGELTHVMQQKEKQRQMMMNMRQGASAGGGLSAINEDAVAAAAAAGAPLSESGHHMAYAAAEYDYDDEEDYTYTSSTLASTDPSGTTGSHYYENDGDDVSESSSFFTQDASIVSESSFFRLRQEGTEDTIPSHIENIGELDHFHHERGEDGNTASGSGTAPGSQWSRSNGFSNASMSQGTSTGASGIWSPLVGNSSQNSVNSAEWSMGTAGKSQDGIFSQTSALAAEEDVHQHLPTSLLDDIGQDGADLSLEEITRGTANVAISTAEDNRKSSRWFGGRKKLNDDAQALSNSERTHKARGSGTAPPPGF
mmetsp:Transcript_11694/g.28389  ORF Transcript_11694/g.28389 Transcript_11694/m.28389 type:complete len:596 (+) Transcript_11694:144-1931(+)